MLFLDEVRHDFLKVFISATQKITKIAKDYE